MELSLLNLQETASARPMGERRRRIRHQLHSPVYASFNGPSAGMALDLSELFDLSEDGFSVHTGTPLEINQSIRFSLDLPETKSYIHGSGRTVWSNDAGRYGIRFAELPEQSQRVLKEWLLINLLIACTRRAGQVSARVGQKPSPQPATLPPAAPMQDRNGMLAAVEEVRREVRAVGDDFQAALHLITERALQLTGASGAALAFLTDDRMICRASAGEPALPLGTVVDVKQGLTGECVRSGKMVACNDAEIDERVDREICRALGIRSILAAPIFSDFRVVGLLEVFSPAPQAFSDLHQTILDRHVELVPKTQPAVPPAQESIAKAREQFVSEPPPTMAATPAILAASEAVWEPEVVAQEPLKGVPVRLGHILLLALTVAVLALASGYVLAPKIEKLWMTKSASASTPATAQGGATQAASTPITQATPFDELHKRAQRGDAYAQWVLGTRYHNGEGVPQNDVEAMRWFERAADQGYSDAQATSGAYYWVGRGVPKDLIKAYFWSTLALNQGDSSMESRLEGLQLQMTPAQVGAAQAEADEWRRQHRAAKQP